MKTAIRNSSFNEIKSLLQKIDSDQILIVVDSRVWEIYKKTLKENSPENKDVIIYKALEGEETKTFQELERCLEFFIEKRVHRNAHMVAIGGGAISDFTGFVAASINRGISWSIIPTTLLSMVDASIGGKTGINSKHGKNLIGAFHLPENIWLNLDFLESLSSDHFTSGVGEIIKYAFLSEKINNLIKNGEDLLEIIEACASFKEEIVEKDFKEKGDRICLNLGHTFGHALEKIYSLPHGVAIFWGLSLIFKLKGQDEFLEHLRILEKGLNVEFGSPPWFNKSFPVVKIMDYVSKDKKVRSTKKIDTIQIKKIGTFEIESFELSEMENILETKKEELRGFNF